MLTRGVSGDRSSRGLPVFVVLLYSSIPHAMRTHALRDMQYGAPVQTAEDVLPLSKHGRHNSSGSAVPVSEKRLQQLRAASVEFDKACSYENQVQRDQADSLQSMHNGECDGIIWGQKELVSSLKGMRNFMKNVATPQCWQSSFDTLEGPRTKTWRLCAIESPKDYHFFSWARPVDSPEGTCTWLKATRKVDMNSIIKCLKEVNLQEEVAVSGVAGSHSGCTACGVGEWHETSCDSWCEDGLKGRYRSITSHGNAEYCKVRGDPNCDECPPLWDVQRCNTDVSCATGLQRETHYCPTEGESGQHATTWKKCQERCASSFARSNGEITDLSTYDQAECVRFSFRNDTSTCILHPLHTCPPHASTPDPLWISGDVLSPSSDETSIVWSDWLQWSSCDKVDSSVGWKKRIRRVKKWGYAGDNTVDSSAWIDVAPCDSARPLKENDVNLARVPHLMCWVYTEFEDWSSVKCIPECGTDRVKTRRRKIRQQPVPQENGEFSPECAAELPAEALEQKQSCPGDVDCTSKCIFADWAPWSECACTDENGGVGRRLRARLLESGDPSVCGPLEENEKCETTSCRTTSSSNTLYAFAGGVGALVLLLATVFWYTGSRNRSQEEEHM